MTSSVSWLMFMWSAFSAMLALLVFCGRWRNSARGFALVVMLLAAIPCLPAVPLKATRYQPATQVIYRFDDYRHLEMQGYGCEGAIYYVDEKRGTRTSYIDQFARVYLPKFIHADSDGDYVFIPYSDASAFAVSKDHGATFQDARWIGMRTFGVEAIQAITVVNRQAFIELEDGRLFMTSKPVGEYWGMSVVDPINELPELVQSERAEYHGLPTKVPEVKNYQGWDEMRCDPDLRGEPIELEVPIWNRIQQEITSLLGNTIAFPVVWAYQRLG